MPLPAGSRLRAAQASPFYPLGLKYLLKTPSSLIIAPKISGTLLFVCRDTPSPEPDTVAGAIVFWHSRRESRTPSLPLLPQEIGLYQETFPSLYRQAWLGNFVVHYSTAKRNRTIQLSAVRTRHACFLRLNQHKSNAVYHPTAFSSSAAAPLMSSEVTSTTS